MDKKTGDVKWMQGLESFAYASPVAVYNESGKGWIIQPTGDGKITMFDGLTGKVVTSMEVEGIIEASPAVYNNTLVIGTTGRDKSFIYGITLE